MPRNVDFADRTAVVTGGASGIGKGMAAAFKSAGCNVVIADIDEAELAATARELGVLGVRTDVTDPDSVNALADRAVAEYGEVHVICNNAGVGPFGSMSEMTLSDWRWVLDINLNGVLHGVQAFLRLLERNADWGTCGQHLVAFGDARAAEHRRVRGQQGGRAGPDRGARRRTALG